MAEHERTKKRNELKIKKRDYTGYDDEEFMDGQAGMRKAILAKYDEDLEGARETVSVWFAYYGGWSSLGIRAFGWAVIRPLETR